MHVAGLHIHPLKSGAIVDLAEAAVTPLGLAGDRWLMVVDRMGHFVTQRAHPKLALLRVDVGAEFEGSLSHAGERVAASGRASNDPERRRAVASVREAFDLQLRFSAPERPDLTTTASPHEPTRVELWGDWVDAVTLDPALDDWVSRYLDDDLRVVRFAEHATRIADQQYAGPDDQVGFADGFAILVAGTASLADLNERLTTPVPMSRFRPNIVVATDEPWIEDSWRRIRVGGVELAIVKPCGRCVVVNVDQATGRSGREPLRTLASFRQQGHRVVFGQNATPRGVGLIRLGDPVEVLERS